MEKIDITSLQLDDVLARLTEHEQYVTVFDSATSGGWTPTVAWNPSERFELAYDQTADITASIEAFVTSQQKANRLLIGYLSYEVGATLHGVQLRTNDDLKTPMVLIYSFDNWMTFENKKSTLHTVSPHFNSEVIDIMHRQPRPHHPNIYRKGLSPVWSRGAYDQAYVQVKDYIRAGDVYQINLTHRLQGSSDASGLDIYRHVAAASEADFRAYISGPDFEVISMSPERFVHIREGVIETSPVKGTRPRGVTPEQDEMIRIDLATNPKDNAELNMITDLMRNDLGAICRVGSIKVTEERILSAYPTLWHAHSTIRGELSSTTSPIAALVALMPGGSITGCPKKRAIEIINELEEERRGIYTGSIFTMQPTGELDSNIAIRTMIKKDDTVYLSVGGGIVYNSDEQDEYNESLQKAQVFMS